METIVEKARELGKLIKETEEFKKLGYAQVAHDADFDLQANIREFGEVRDQMIEKMSGGVEKTPETEKLEAKMSALFKEIKGNANMQALENASKAFDGVMKMVYDVLQMEITGEPPHSCSSDCSSCSGCH